MTTARAAKAGPARAAKAGKTDIRRINLALQGGGAHGAFTWGVIDRLLDEPNIEFEGLSGTSAGAVNAVVLAHGLMEAGRIGGQAALEDFWRRSSRGGSVWSPVSSLPQGVIPGMEFLSAATYAAFDTMTRTFS
ncbi:MAG: patatin-like phospholipase family protein, partial [Alphaproteobacteria bacterium]|nr:patatin-like phospholipase family protein [Alphaproteobacteria bacterium]